MVKPHRLSSPSDASLPQPLTPRHANLLTASHYLLLPLLNASLLIFAIAMNYAYIYPTSIPLSLPFHLYGENIFRIFYLLLCLAALAVGGINIWTLYTSVTRLPTWRRRWAWWCERPELSWAIPLPRLVVVQQKNGREFGREGVRFGKPVGFPAWKMVAGLVFAVVGVWGIVAAVGFREMFKRRAWEMACGEKDDEGWGLFAEIRVMNGGRGVQYDGAGAGTPDEETEKWGTSSRVTFYTLADRKDLRDGGREGQLLYRHGKWRWEYEMDLVRRYDLPWGLARYKSYKQVRKEKESDPYYSEEDNPYKNRVLVFALHDFRNSASYNIGEDGDGGSDGKNDTLTFRGNHTDYDTYNSRGNKTNEGHLWDFSPYFNGTGKDGNGTSSTATSITTSTETTLTTTTTTTTTTPSPTPSTLNDLKKPYLSTADILSTPNPIPNPFPLFKPPSHQPNPLRSSYPPIQKVIYFLSNSTWRAFLTNTTSPGFPALEESGGWDAGGKEAGTFVVGGGATFGAGWGDEEGRWSWKWEVVQKLAGRRWRWDGYFPRMVVGGKGGSGFGGLCLPPRVRLRRKGRGREVLKTVEVVGGGCGVVRVCGVAGGEGHPGGGGAGGGSGRREEDEGGVGWESGGWKRSVEERWAIVVGLVAWEVERWGGCCAVGE